ncbi:hypothetical protein GCM10010123_02090 [Pilimelia anulata]|uniref:Uncharacterized protein n=1 Tax=Pilimelia anulata TaxID=53371 RepID=A0A8J3AYV3_9ACTN|nr:hypothetical protein GCM10010123_02090 [Pilimelia anulata]
MCLVPTMNADIEHLSNPRNEKGPQPSGGVAGMTKAAHLGRPTSVETVLCAASVYGCISGSG